MLDPKTKARIAQEAENWIKSRQIYTPKGCVNHYIAGAEAEAIRAQVLVNALQAMNKELDYYWNSSRAMESRKKMPESIKRALCSAQKECAEALTNYKNPK